MGARWGNRGVPQYIRARILERDHGTCQLGYDGCTIAATEIDHAVNVASLGITRAQADSNEYLLQAVCHACHTRKTEHERLTAWRASQQRRHQRRHLPVPRKHPGEW
jgi:hypothetical protein